MDVSAAFLLPLLGGFAFASLFRVTKYAIRKKDGQHVYFRAAYWGAVLYLAAFLLRLILTTCSPAYRDLETPLLRYLHTVLKQPATLQQAQVVVCTYALLLGPLLAGLSNLFIPKQWAVRRNLSGLDRLLHLAQDADMPVLLSLDTGKIYVGLVGRITDPDHPPASVSIYPMFSGYRNEQGRMALTTDYERVYEILQNDEQKRRELGLNRHWLGNFELVITADSIVTATMFSLGTYSAFNPDWKSTLATQEPIAEPIPRDDGY